MKSVALAIEQRTPHGIASGISRLITTGDLAPGDRLPTVRELASDLGISPATVSHAWQTLAAAGLITSRGRSGSFVRSLPREWLPRRYQELDGAQDAALDLSRGTPDPALLPALGPVLANLRLHADTASYQQKPDIPELHNLLRSTWPSPVESITVTNGALDAIDRAFAVLVRYGDRVVVGNPTFAPFFDLIDSYGLEAIGVPVDEYGMRPSEFAAALGSNPSIVLMQTRSHNPTGSSLSQARADELATILKRSRTATSTIVIEDDHSGAISSAPDLTLATIVPERVLHVRSFSKSHGPDLRIGALGGPRALVDQVVARRLLGPGWTSRTVQAILHALLTDPVAVGQVESARVVYGERRAAIVTELARLGVHLPLGDGINAWLPVAEERAAIVQLAAAGIRVAPGALFQLGDQPPHVRVTVGVVPVESAQFVAGALAAAAVER
ncbi:MAG: aminotransferase class I/II-fold pyridoxal phosphate-dependent enzyme [Pseudolysinimonas sp.]|uniref:aminotransferase-like domain-containing protein n=1 Tax=Pseudolysinimonas sp. TaxID=2680009 RepID=UPI00326307EA